MNTNTMGPNRIPASTAMFVDIVAHTVGFLSGVLAVVSVAFVAAIVLAVTNYDAANMPKWLAGIVMIIVFFVFMGAWAAAARAMQCKMLGLKSPDELDALFNAAAPSAPASVVTPNTSAIVASLDTPDSLDKDEIATPIGELESVYRFLDANGEVILQTKHALELKEALYSGRVRPETLCQPIAASGEAGCARRLCDSKLTRCDVVAALLTPLEHYNRAGEDLGVKVGAWVFLAVWIATAYQRTLASLSWPAYIGALFAVGAVAYGIGWGVGVVWGHTMVESKMRAAKSLGYSVAGKPMSLGRRAAILMVCGLLLGGLVLFSLGTF